MLYQIIPRSWLKWLYHCGMKATGARSYATKRVTAGIRLCVCEKLSSYKRILGPFWSSFLPFLQARKALGLATGDRKRIAWRQSYVCCSDNRRLVKCITIGRVQAMKKEKDFTCESPNTLLVVVSRLEHGRVWKGFAGPTGFSTPEGDACLGDYTPVNILVLYFN